MTATTTAATDLWQFRQSAAFAAKGVDLSGYDVEGRDGPLGTVHGASNDVRVDSVVVDTGDRLVLLPAGTVARVDPSARRLVVDLTREQVHGSPPFDPHARRRLGFQDAMHGYYHGIYDTGL